MGVGKLFDLTGKVAIVTGSSRGIGRAVAEAMAAHGAKVVVSSRKADACEPVAAGIREAGGEAAVGACNVSYREQCEALVAETRRLYGKVDILVGNAGANPYYGPGADIPDAAFDKIIQVNVKSNLWLTGLVAPEMRERRDGAIIYVSSIGGLRASRVIGAYCIAKAGDMQMARNFASEYGPDNVRVNCIAPGLVKTEFARALYENPDVAQKRIEGTPLRRLGEPEDIAGAAVYLASPAGSWMTGQTLVVDGGVTIEGG